MKNFIIVIVALLAFPATAQPDLSVFTNHAQVDQVSLSPDGRYIAYTQREDNVEALTVLNTADLSIVSNTNFGSEIEIDNFTWVSNERILFSPARSGWGITDFYQRTGEIFGVDFDGSNFKVLFGYLAGGRSAVSRSNGMIRGREAMQAYAELVDLLPDEPNYVLIQDMGYGVEGEFNSAWRMNVNTGNLRRVKKSPLRNGNFTTDHNHEVRFVAGTTYENTRELYFLNNNDDWELIRTDENLEDWFSPVVAYDEGGSFLVSNTDENGILGYSIWNSITDDMQDYFHHEQVDIFSRFTDNTQATWAVNYMDHYSNYYYPDPEHKFVAVHQQLRRAFPNQDVRIISETDDLTKIIVYLTGPQNPGDFVLMDLTIMEYTFRLFRFPDFPVESLSPMEPFDFSARDDTVIRGYITSPKVENPTNLPMVVMVHGGPFGVYDNWEYNFEVQMLASRGYAVLQVNYRGSGGRGYDFRELGKGEWGGTMQDDVTDAVRWAIRDGVADPERICIYGGSYGAFAALSGVAKEPDMFKCAIGMSGVYDLNLMSELGDIADAVRGQSYLEEYVGNDASQLSARSPVTQAAQINANVMLIHGELDDRAPIEHAERMKDALEENGHEVVWLVEKREDHGIVSEENRAVVYQGMLNFLEENIGH